MDCLSDYDYDLPESAIAQTPLVDRAGSRLLFLHKNGALEHRAFRDIPDILAPGDLLVLNDTRVTALRLFGHKKTGGKIELLLLNQRDGNAYEALAKPGNRLQPGTVAEFENGLECVFLRDLGEGKKLIQFKGQSVEERLRQVGQVPLPPYIHNSIQDPERYQTVYNSHPGSAAAPTAGLHFTPEILSHLKAQGVGLAWVTLSVGLDTFRPVQTENLGEHAMHGEQCIVPEATVTAVANCEGRVIAVGTTTVRTLESFAVGKRLLSAGEKTTSIFILPGYKFQIIDGMFTNFHMPRTTMLIMLSALVARESLMSAYAEALKEGYRFLSFGDSMLIL